MFFARTVFATVFLLLTATAIPAAETPAPADSVSVATYLELPKKERKERRNEAKDLRERARNEPNGMVRLGLLRQAAVTDPADVGHWLELADRQAVMGYDADSDASLAAARVCLKFLRGDERKEAIGDYSLAMAWRQYRLGEWQKGQDWARRALKAGAGLDGHLLLQLHRSKIFRSRLQYADDMSPFEPYWNDWRRMGHYDWCRVMFVFFHYEEYDGPYLADRLDKRAPNRYVQEPLRWRDHGMYAESHEERGMALRFYGMSADAIAARDGGWLRRLERSNPVRRKDAGPMPFWVNRDDGYVTGSLLAYLGWLRDEMTAESDATRQDVLAELLLVYAGRTAARYELFPWPALWQAEAMLELDETTEAAEALRYARDKFRVEGIEDPAVDRVHGRILVVQKKFGHAAKLLRQAVVDFPDDATCWSDLGIAEAMTGEKTRAREAFDRALALDKELAAAWYNRGLLSMKEGDLQSAQADMERAVELVPGNAEIRGDLAKLVQKANAQHRGQ